MTTTQVKSKLSGYGELIFLYQSLSLTDREYIRRGIDERGKRIKQLLKEVRKNRHSDKHHAELKSLIESVKKDGEAK